MGIFQRIFKRNKNRETVFQGHTEYLRKFQLSKNIDDNRNRLLDIMNNSFDIKSREFNIGGTSLRSAVVYIENLVDEPEVMEHILKPLILESVELISHAKKSEILDIIKDSIISIGDIEDVFTFDEIVLGILSGDTFLCIEGHDRGLLIKIREYEGKPFSIPETEPSVKGPKEGLVETLKRNIGFIRKRVRDPNLTMETFMIGRRTKTDLVMTYIKGIADPDLVEDVRKKLKEIDIDGTVAAIEIGNFMVDRPRSIFPLIQATERVDKLVAGLLQGRVAVIMNGAPECIIVPATLPILMQSVDDYYESWVAVTLIRATRYLGLFISTLFPSLYIALTSFNPGMLPTKLVLSITGSRVGVPFPAIIEALLMVFTLELLHEAGIRLPNVVGQAVAIVGGLVIGQSAVQAGIVSPIMVIIISITALSAYQIPDYSLSLTTRILRIPFMALASVLGSFGVAIGLLFLIAYLTSLKSFGYRYLSPISPFSLSDFKDTIFKSPRAANTKRPEFLNTQDVVRAKNTESGNKK